MHKTNFSFELQYAALSPVSLEQRNTFMTTLEAKLLALLNVNDPTATVVIYNSHKGNDNKILELVTTASDAEIAALLKTFCSDNGIDVSALE